VRIKQSLSLSYKINHVSTEKSYPRLPTNRSNYYGYIQARWIGKSIRDALNNASSGIIRGTTSRGIFLDIANDWVLYLTDEQDRGPLTLNLEQKLPEGFQTSTGITVRVERERILFDSVYLAVNIANAQIFSSLDILINEKQRRKMAIRNSAVAGYINFLRQSLTEANDYLEAALITISPGSSSFIIEPISVVHKAILTRDPTSASAAIAWLAGRGRGLTPSGDDYLSGLLFGLRLTRLTDYPDISRLQQIILNTIRDRSTKVSACLAICAAEGEIDERMASTVNYLVYGDHSLETAVKNTLSWGRSSGIVMISGFISALKLAELRSAGRSAF